MNQYPVVEHPQEFKSRLGGYGDFYFINCESEYSLLVDLERKYEEETDDIVRSEIGDLCFNSGVKVIVFAALSVEACINDYAG